MLDPWFKNTYPLKHLKKWAYWPWADYRVLRDAAAVLFTTEQERQLARQSFWLYQAKEALENRSPPGFTPCANWDLHTPTGAAEGFSRASLEHFPQLYNKHILLYLSRIHLKKGVDLLIESFAAVASIDPRLQLVIAGPN